METSCEFVGTPVRLRTFSAGSKKGDSLFPLYVSAARDYSQPLFAYGPPRLVRLGVELFF